MELKKALIKLLTKFTTLFILLLPLLIDGYIYKNIIDILPKSILIKIIIFAILYLILLVITFVTAIYIPKGNKKQFNVCVIFSCEDINIDDRIYKQSILSNMSEYFQNNKNINIISPVIISRYFFNYFYGKYPYLSKFKKFLLKLTLKTRGLNLIIFGQIQPITNKGQDSNNLRVNICSKFISSDIEAYSEEIIYSINKKPITYSIDDELNQIKKISDFAIICTLIYYSFYGYSNLKHTDSLSVLMDAIKYCKEGINKEYMQNALSVLTKFFFIEASYSQKIDINQYIAVCEKVLELYPNNTDIHLAYQYYSMLQARQSPNITRHDYSRLIKDMLKNCNDIKYFDENHSAILANKAYLNLLNCNYEKALCLYDELFQLNDKISLGVMCQIFEYYRDVPEDAFEYQYARFAYAYYNYKKNSSPEAKNMALRDFKNLESDSDDVFIMNKSSQIAEQIESEM